MLNSIIDSAALEAGSVLICLAGALLLGVAASFVCSKAFGFSRSLSMTLALLPIVSATVILVVNGSLGAGIAVAGAFSLIRFRSAQGSALEILAVFLAMAMGVCAGAGYVVIAAIVLAISLAALLALKALKFGSAPDAARVLKISVPEALDYEGLFDDILGRYTAGYELESVHTAEMGSVYRLEYRITLPRSAAVRAMLDEIRTRNGNLEVMCGRIPEKREAF